MSSLSAQVARAHSQWLEIPDDSRYTRDDIDAKCREINGILEDFSVEWCGGVEESSHVTTTITALKDLIKELTPLAGELEEIELNQDTRQEGYL